MCLKLEAPIPSQLKGRRNGNKEDCKKASEEAGKKTSEKTGQEIDEDRREEIARCGAC
jgi:hypothetical protein